MVQWVDMPLVYSDLILKQKSRVLKIAVVTAVLAVGASFLFPLKYSATTRVLVIPKSSPAVDPYTAAKASERIGENLARVVETASFLEQVLKAGYAIDATPWNTSERVRRKRWARAVDAHVVPGTGLLGITAYATDRRQAEEIAKATAAVLTGQGWQYVPGEVQFRVVDTPVATRFPVRPNIFLNALLGFMLGAIVGAGYVLMRAPS